MKLTPLSRSRHFGPLLARSSLRCSLSSSRHFGPLLARSSLRCSLSWMTGLLLALGLLAGCTGVPTDSAPLVVRTVDRSQSGGPQPKTTPRAGAEPRDIVQGFLTAGVAADAGHSQARQFLTNAAARKWQDTTVTVVDDETTVTVPTLTGKGATIEVVGHRIGQLDATGVYTPSLKDTGADPEKFSFDLVKVEGQWRIDQLQTGVLIRESPFDQSYQARRLYFFDSTESTLVPDLRYCALSGQALATWLLSGLLAGPRPELAQAVTNEMPDQVGRPTVVDGDPIVVEMPGTSQLDGNGRNRLAAQLAYTLAQMRFVAGAQIKLTDSGHGVVVPLAHSSVFGAVTFSSVGPDSVAPGVQAYFVRDGTLIDGIDNKPVTGLLGQAGAGLTSVALRRNSTGDLQVAAVAGDKLQMGSATRLSGVTLPKDALSRPEWRPHADEVWIGVGKKGAIFRIRRDGVPQPVSITSSVGGLPPGQVRALRFSPDGVRLAVVLRSQDGSSAAWTGSVVTSGSDVRVDAFELLTPAGLRVDDLAWADTTQLLMVAQAANDETRVWQVLSDGSKLGGLTNLGLPDVPTTIAAAAHQPPLVSASNSMWVLDSSQWKTFPGTTLTGGTNPVYAP
jgi:lipoprotein LpqB-like beta-propeller protein/sporulation and spore germination protein